MAPGGVGDVVLYSIDGSPDALILHRLIGGNAETGWWAQGDNNPQMDPWLIPDDHVLGTAVLRIPAAGVVLVVARQPAFVIGAIGIGLLWYIVMVPGRKRRLERYPVEEPASVAGIPATVRDMHAEGARFHLESDQPLEMESQVPVDAWVLDEDGQRTAVHGTLTIRYDNTRAEGDRSVGGPVTWASREDVDRIMHHVQEYVLRNPKSYKA